MCNKTIVSIKRQNSHNYFFCKFHYFAQRAAVESNTPETMPIEVNNVDAAFAAAFPAPASPTANTPNNHENAETQMEVGLAATATAVATTAVPVAEEIHDFTGTTQSVEDSHIVSNTRTTYSRSLTDFMIWLFSFSRNKLVNQEALIAAKAEDDRRETEKQRKAKKGFWAECMRQLKRMNRIEGNSPIHLSGPNAIAYDDIAKYMGTKRRIVSVDPDLANQLAAEEGALVVNYAGGGGKVKVAVRLSDSSYSAIQSAISFLYRQCGIERPIEIKDGLALYCKGSKRKGRKLKQSLGLVISEGKKAMSREVYSFLAKKMFTSKKKEHIFAHLFLLLDWCVHILFVYFIF